MANIKFKQFDRERNGYINAEDYALLHKDLVDAKVIDASIEEATCLAKLLDSKLVEDTGSSGKHIYLSRFVDFIEEVIYFSNNTV